MKKKNEKLAETMTNRRAAKKNKIEFYGQVPPIIMSGGGGPGVPSLDLSASQPIALPLMSTGGTTPPAEPGFPKPFISSPGQMAQRRTSRIFAIAQETLNQMQEDILEQMVNHPDEEEFEFHFVEHPTDGVYLVLERLKEAGWQYKWHPDDWRLVLQLPKVVEHAAKWITDPGRPL